MAILLGLVWQFFPLADASHRLRLLPQAGVGITSVEVPLKSDEKQILRDATVIRRAYRMGGQPVLLTVIDGTRNRHAVHDPFYCLRGDGWQILSENPFGIRGGHARLIRITRDGQESEALVWFSDGRQRYGSATRYWWQTTLRRLSLGLSGDEPVLVNVQPVGKEIINWRQLIEQFPALTQI
ncbi:MAG: exosortase-associated EpsI family protein [Verrucomicrobiota bacterium]